MAWQIVRQRIHQHLWRDGRVWNSFPGGLMTLPDYTDSPSRLPWNGQSTSVTTSSGQSNNSQFTAVIYSQQQAGSPLVPAATSGPLLHLLRVVSRSQHVARVRFQIEVYVNKPLTDSAASRFNLILMAFPLDCGRVG